MMRFRRYLRKETSPTDLRLAYSNSPKLRDARFRRWVREAGTDKKQAFAGRGQMKVDDAEVARLKRELVKTKAERDISKRAIGFFTKEPT